MYCSTHYSSWAYRNSTPFVPLEIHYCLLLSIHMCVSVCSSVSHIEMVNHLRRTMTSTSELFTLMTLGLDDVALQKYLPELAKVALMMVRVLVVVRLIITVVTSTLPRAASSKRVPFWYHNTSRVGNPLALQRSVPSSKRDIFVSTGSSSRMGFTGGRRRWGARRIQWCQCLQYYRRFCTYCKCKNFMVEIFAIFVGTTTTWKYSPQNVHHNYYTRDLAVGSQFGIGTIPLLPASLWRQLIRPPGTTLRIIISRQAIAEANRLQEAANANGVFTPTSAWSCLSSLLSCTANVLLRLSSIGATAACNTGRSYCVLYGHIGHWSCCKYFCVRSTEQSFFHMKSHLYMQVHHMQNVLPVKIFKFIACCNPEMRRDEYP